MSQKQEREEVSSQMTSHAMLVIWGLFAVRIGLVEAIEKVSLKQKKRVHSPQTKVIEFLVAILGGLAHLQEISRSAHPLDQDQMVAEAWGQPAWADYSGVSRTLSQLTEAEVDELIGVLDSISQPFIDQEVALSLKQTGELVYDADLTGRPVSSSSSSYPDAAFGYMGGTIELGYQAALVSLDSPTYGRLWLSNELHPGDTVSMSCTSALVRAGEERTGCRPWRRTELLAERVSATQSEGYALAEKVETSVQQCQEAQEKLDDTKGLLQQWEQELGLLIASYQQENRSQTSHCQLSRAQHKVATYQQRLPRCQKSLEVAQRRLARQKTRYDAVQADLEQLEAHYQQLQADNAANPNPIRAIFRLDGGFTTLENLYWLIEMGYDVYTRGRFPKVRDTLSDRVADDTEWYQVGRNASMTAWHNTTVDDYFAYPLDVALLHYHTGDTVQRATLLHYGQADAVLDWQAWFHTYNGRQTIEAGIKEGKNVFQMHHLKVRSAPALRLQEHMACFAANFVRFSADWLVQQEQPMPLPTQSVKQMVQVVAHTSAWVHKQGDEWLLSFTEHSCYAGYSLHFGNRMIQLPLPSMIDFHFVHF